MTVLEHFMGEIVMFAGLYAPEGWHFCDGQHLAINEYAALYSIIGNTYGGDGRTYFALPNLQARFPMHPGNGFQPGNVGGNSLTYLSVNNLPAHNHQLKASTDDATVQDAPGNVLAKAKGRYDPLVYGPSANLDEMSPDSISSTGGGQPFSNLPPFLTVNFIICLDGVYPPRS